MSLPARACLLVLSVALLCATSYGQAPAAADDAIFAPMDIFGLEYASDPQISPDGASVAYVRTSMDIMADRRRSDVWLIDVASGTQRPMTSGSDASSPRWSPDGKRLLYAAADDDNGAELFVRWMDTGDVARITQLASSPGDLTWSPTGDRVAFTMNVSSTPEPIARMPTAPQGAEWAAPPIVIEAMRFRSDGEGMVEPRRRHVFVVPSEGGTARQLTKQDADHQGPLGWLATRDEIVFTANFRDDADFEPLDSAIYAVGVRGGEVRRLQDRRGPDGRPVVSPNGRLVAFTGFEDRVQGYQTQDLAVLDVDGSAPTIPLLADLDRDVDAVEWSADGETLFVQYDDRGTTFIGSLSLQTGGWEPQLVADVGGTSLGRPYGGGSFSVSDSGAIAFTLGTSDRPADVALRAADGTVTRLTSLNEDLLGHKTLGEVEEFWCTSSHDGRDVQGWIITPPGFDARQKYPLLLEIHGGPFANYGPRFAAELQLYAAAGNVVVYVNPRGSTSYGEEFGNLIHHAYPSHDYEDLMSAVDHVIGRGFIDESQMYVTGGSGGGVLTAWIVGKTERFRAAVVAKPVINWASFVLTADAYSYFTKYWFPTTPWEDPMHYWERSPLSLVGNVSTPTMLLTGEQDMRTPIAQSEEFYQALKLRGVDTALVRMPGASHGIAARPSQLMGKILHVLGWFDRYAPKTEE